MSTLSPSSPRRAASLNKVTLVGKPRRHYLSALYSRDHPYRRLPIPLQAPEAMLEAESPRNQQQSFKHPISLPQFRSSQDSAGPSASRQEEGKDSISGRKEKDDAVDGLDVDDDVIQGEEKKEKEKDDVDVDDGMGINDLPRTLLTIELESANSLQQVRNAAPFTSLTPSSIITNAAEPAQSSTLSAPSTDAKLPKLIFKTNIAHHSNVPSDPMPLPTSPDQAKSIIDQPIQPLSASAGSQDGRTSDVGYEVDEGFVKDSQRHKRGRRRKARHAEAANRSSNDVGDVGGGKVRDSMENMEKEQTKEDNADKSEALNQGLRRREEKFASTSRDNYEVMGNAGSSSQAQDGREKKTGKRVRSSDGDGLNPTKKSRTLVDTDAPVAATNRIAQALATGPVVPVIPPTTHLNLEVVAHRTLPVYVPLDAHRRPNGNMANRPLAVTPATSAPHTENDNAFLRHFARHHARAQHPAIPTRSIRPIPSSREMIQRMSRMELGYPEPPAVVGMPPNPKDALKIYSHIIRTPISELVYLRGVDLWDRVIHPNLSSILDDQNMAYPESRPYHGYLVDPLYLRNQLNEWRTDVLLNRYKGCILGASMSDNRSMRELIEEGNVADAFDHRYSPLLLQVLAAKVDAQGRYLKEGPSGTRIFSKDSMDDADQHPEGTDKLRRFLLYCSSAAVVHNVGGWFYWKDKVITYCLNIANTTLTVFITGTLPEDRPGHPSFVDAIATFRQALCIRLGFPPLGIEVIFHIFVSLSPRPSTCCRMIVLTRSVIMPTRLRKVRWLSTCWNGWCLDAMTITLPRSLGPQVSLIIGHKGLANITLKCC
jgi:hypothetical protein